MFIRPHYRRKDGKQVCLGLVVSKCGMPLGYEVFAGNRNDVTTLEEIVETMERRYIVGTPKSMLKQFERELLAEDWKSIRDGLEVKLCPTPDGRAELVWRKFDAWREWAELSEGCYLLRSNVTDWSAEDLWQAYIQLTEAEAAFRIHKSDLRIRPIWHQREDRVLAHIQVCFLAYVLWKTLAQMCRAAGLGDEPRRVFDELDKISLVDVILPTRAGPDLRRRCITRPTDHQAILLQHLGLNLPKNLKTNSM